MTHEKSAKRYLCAYMQCNSAGVSAGIDAGSGLGHE